MQRARSFGLVGCLLLLGIAAVSAVACSSGTAPEGTSRGLRYEASTRLVDSSGWGRKPTVLASLVVTNVADTVQRLQYSDCIEGGPVRLRATTTIGARTATWDSYRGFPEFQCLLVLYNRTLPPRGQTRFDLAVPISRILGDSLSPGTFSFTVDAAELQPAYRGELMAGQLSLNR